MKLHIPVESLPADWQTTSASGENPSETQRALFAVLAEFFVQQMPNIDRKLVHDLSFISQLAHYKEGMQVRSVERLPAGENLQNFYLHFEYQWHIFNGCMGMDETGHMKDKVKFTLNETGEIQLDLTPFQTLSTADEL